MTVAEAERLVRRIEEALRGGGEAEWSGLARAYADLCAAANHRLEACAGMLQAGNEQQALQLANAAPPLLDLVAVLAFRDLEPWQRLCRTKGLPVAESLSGRGIRMLNSAYAAHSISPAQLTKQYREAVLRENDDLAWSILQEIRRLNPGDSNARQESARLEQKLQMRDEAELAGLIEAGDRAAIAAKVRQIEELPFGISIDEAAWRRAQQMICETLLDDLHRARQADDWKRGLILMDELRRRREACSSPATPASDALDQWLESHRKEEREQEELGRLLRDFQRTAAEAETALTRRESLGMGEAASLETALQTRWHELAARQPDIPPDLERRHLKILRLLRAQIDRKRRVQRTLGGGILAALLVLMAVLGWNYLEERRLQEWADQLSSFQAERRVREMQDLLARIDAQRSSLPAGPVADAVRSARETVAVELIRKESFDQWMERLDSAAQSHFTNAPVAEIEALFEAAERQQSELSPEFQPGATARIDGARRAWSVELPARRRASAARLAAEVTELEERLGPIKLVDGPERAERFLSEAAVPLQSLRSASADLGEEAPRELAAAARSIERRVELIETELTSWQEAWYGMRSARAIPEYLAALSNLQRSELAPAGQRQAARRVLGLDSTALPRLLLIPREAQPLLRLADRLPPLRFAPDEIAPAEREKLNLLRDDALIHAVQSALLTVKTLPEGSPQRDRRVYVKGEVTTNRFGRKEAEVYDAAVSTGELAFVRREFQAGEFDLGELRRTKEAEAFDRAIRPLVDAEAPRLEGGILEALARLQIETNAHPVFKAYAAWQLHAVGRVQPFAWGYAWSPSAQQAGRALAELEGGALRSGDWLVPDRAREVAPRFEAHFSAAPIEYPRQARFVHAWLESALPAGTGFAGFADAAGVPVVAAAERELWGWAAGAEPEPGLLWEWNEGNWHAVREPLPFTPLLRFEGPVAGVFRSALERVGIAEKSREVQSALPPLIESRRTEGGRADGRE